MIFSRSLLWEHSNTARTVHTRPICHLRVFVAPISCPRYIGANLTQRPCESCSRKGTWRKLEFRKFVRVIIMADFYQGAGELPPNWTEDRDPNGRVFYINHFAVTTTWEMSRAYPLLASRDFLLVARQMPDIYLLVFTPGMLFSRGRVIVLRLTRKWQMRVNN